MRQHWRMRLLILGGNAFLGRATANAAIAHGDTVTCAARGQSGEIPDGAQFVTIDRDDPSSYGNIHGTYDAVMDVSSRPSHVRGALAALADRVDHWVYVSSGSVYTDSATPNQRVEGAPIHDPAPPEVDDPFANGFVNYGPCKVACEGAVLDRVGTDNAFICRAGLIVGPEDRSDRFTYWPERVARGGEILAPGAPDDLVQWVDVRDLGDWLARAGRDRIAGTYNGIGVPVSRGEFLDAVAAGVAVTASQFTWVPDAFLVEHGVNPWAGPRSLPLWLPLPDYAGFLTHDGTEPRKAGLAMRPLSDTARETLTWARTARSADPSRKAGLTDSDEADVLAAWRAAAA
jgi:nucleoside-diphosphate-sugar epimerase